MNELLKLDSNFSESKFISYVDNVFIQIHLSLMNNTLEDIDHFVNDEVYNELKERLDILNQNNEIQVFGEINVNGSKILECIEKEDSFVLKVSVIARYLDYIIDKDTKTKKRGNNQTRVVKNSILSFERQKNFKERNIARQCPNCGSNMDLNHSGKCKYCGSIYKQEDYDWILTSITVM